MINPMFKNLKVGDKIYILKDTDGLSYFDCVVNVAKPESANATDLVKGVYSPITIIAKADEEEFKLDRINAMQDYVELTQPSGTIIISTVRDKINDYTKKVYDESKKHLSKMDEYKKKVEDGESILSNLSNNPNDLNEIRFNKIEDSVSKMNTGMEQMLEMLKRMSPKEEEQIKKEV